MNYSQPHHQETRQYLAKWQEQCHKNFFLMDSDFQHCVTFYFPDNSSLKDELSQFAEKLAKEAEPLVSENYYRLNYPRLEKYNSIGENVEHIQHHPNYEKVGNIIYGSRIVERLSYFGGMLESLLFFFLSGQLGEAGHNCPFACSAGIIRVLQKAHNIPQANYFIKKLCEPSYTNNYTGAQFLTEIQGGSDVGQNATLAWQDDTSQWHIRGEKWFCSNANADLILMTARYDESIPGTKGLGLFLVPRYLDNGELNHFSILRLKEKIGTNAMASGEIVFQDTIAYPVGNVEDGFKLVMENVLHISRLCNSMCVLGMSRRAYHIAHLYAQHRIAFGQAIIHYPLVMENLAHIKAENDAALAGTLATIYLQDQFDLAKKSESKQGLLLRLLANLCKYITALWSVEHIHHSIDMLAGNGAIETFSPLPRLLRDSIVCENWEGTHNTLRLQILRDIDKFDIGTLLFKHLRSSQSLLQNKDRVLILEKHLLQLEESYQEFKQADVNIKMLLIKPLIDSMCFNFLAHHLLNEAEHQTRTQKKNSKLYSFDLFSYLHLEKKHHVNQAYFELINQVIGGKD